MTKATFSITSALLIAMSLTTAQASNKTVQGKAADHQAGTTLREIEQSAARAAEDVDPLLNESQLSADSHYDRLMALKDDINTMGREMSTLEAESASLAPWEK